MMKNLNRINLSILFLSLFLGLGHLMHAQNAEKWSEAKIERYFKKKQQAASRQSVGLKNASSSGSLKGVLNGITSLSAMYCSNETGVKLVPNSWPAGAKSIEWVVTTFVGGEEQHTEWGELIQEGADITSSVYNFYLDRIGSIYLGERIYFEYTIKDDLGFQLTNGYAFDYTFVHLYPNSYTFQTDQAICSGESVTLSLAGSDSGIKYQIKDELNNDVGFEFTGIGDPITFSSITPSATTTYHVEAVNADEATCAISDLSNDVTVTVNTPQAIVASNDGPVCVGDPINLSVDISGLTYSWTGPDGFTSTSQNPTISGATPAKAGTYTVDIVDLNTCNNSATTTVVVNNLPVPSLLGTADVCVNQPGYTYQTDAGMSNYVWTVSGGTVTAGATSNVATVTWSSVGPQTISVSYTDDKGCAANAATTYNVTVHDLPIPSLIGDAEVCVNEQGTYTTDAGMSNYVWNVSAGGSISAGSNTNEITVDWAGVGPQTVTVTYENTYGCTPTAASSFNVDINPLPVATITSGATSVCLNESGLQYTTQPNMSNYVWTITGGTITAGSTSNTITVTWDQVGPQVLTVTYEDGNSCSPASPGSYNVTVHDLPVPTISGTLEVCENATGVLYSTEVGKANYTWTVTGGTIVSGAGTYQIAVDWGTSGTGTVAVNYEENGCAATTPAEETVTIQAPLNPSLLGSNEECEGATNITYQTDAGMTGYVWNVSSGGTITSGAGSNSIEVSWTTSGAKTVSVYYYNSLGCLSETTTYNVTVNPLPVPTISGNNAACINSTGNVYTTQSGMSNYNWTIVGGTIDVDNGESVEVTWTTTGSQKISVSYDDTKSCSTATPTEYNVTVHPLPNVSISGQTDICLNTEATYSTQPGMSGYSWTVVGGTITSNPSLSSVDVLWNTSGAQSISVNYVNSNGCSAATDYVYNVNVIQPATPIITGSTEECLNTSGVLYTTESSMSSYVWTVSGGTIASGQGSNQIAVTWNQVGTGTVQVSYTDGNTCDAVSDYYDVTVNDLPSPTISGSASVCQGYTEVYTTQSGQFNYDWTVSAGGSIISGGDGSDQIEVQWDGSGPQSISVTYDNSFGCSPIAPAVTNITVEPKPVPTITPSTTTACNGTNTIFTTESNKQNYVWTVTGGTILSGSSTNSIEVQWTTAGMQTVSINYDNLSGCSGGTAAVSNIEVFALETPTISGDNTTCLNTSGVIYNTQSGKGAYNWTISGGTITGGQGSNEITVTWTQVGTGVLTVTYLDGNSCSVTSSDYSVTVNDLPDPSITGNASVCQGYTEMYTTEVGMFNYDWTLSSGGSIVSGGDGSDFIEVSWDNSGAQTISVSYDDGNSCSPATPTVLNVVVATQPVPTITPSTTSVCNLSTTSFTTESGKINYTWLVTGGDIVSGDGTNSIMVQWNTSGNQTVEVNYDNPGGCSGGTPAISAVEVFALPAPSLIGDGSACIGETKTYRTENTGNETNYTWVVTGGTIVSGNNTHEVNVQWDTAGQGTISVNYNDVNGCAAANPTTYNVDVYDITVSLAVTAPVAGVTTICTGTDVTFDATGANGSDPANYTYEFFVDGVSQGAASSASTFLYTVNSDVVVSVEIVDVTTSCISTSSLNITSLETPVVTLSEPLNNAEFCYGEPVTFVANASGVVTNYTFFDATNGVSYNNGNNATYTKADGFTSDVTVYVVGSNGSCSSDPIGTEVDLIIHALPTAGISSSEGNRITANTTVDFTGTGGTDYEFFINGTSVKPRDGVDTYTTNGLNNGDVVRVDVYDANGCMSSDQITMEVIAAIEIKNVVPVGSNEYCQGDAGVSIQIGVPQLNVTYRLAADGGTSISANNPITFDGTNIVRWDNILGDDTYRVFAYYDDPAISDPEVEMNNPVDVIMNPLPGLYNVYSADTGNDTETGCNGGAGWDISLDGSEVGVSYDLLSNGTPFITGVSGTGSSISFGAQNVVGVFTVLATNDITGCTSVMNNSFTILGDGSDVLFNLSVLNPADPADPTDGRYCQGGTGIYLELDGSLDAGVTYKLFRNGIDTGVSLPGADGGTLTFGPITNEGNYTVGVESGSGCTFPMSGSATVSIVPIPQVFNLNSDNTIDNTNGNYCLGGSGVRLILDDQESGVVYDIYRDGVSTGVSVTGTTNGTPLDLGTFTDEGLYTVQAQVPQVGCSEVMNGNIDIVIIDNPALVPVINDVDYFCTGQVTYLTIQNPEIGVEYRWINQDDASTGAWIEATNSGVMNFEISNSGTYIIEGRYVDAYTDCGAVTMDGGPFVITESLLPVGFAISSSGDGDAATCTGEAITVINSLSGITYRVVTADGSGGYIDVSGVSSIQGDGSDMQFPERISDSNGEYFVMATNDRGCEAISSNSVIIAISGAVKKQMMVGEGEICMGELFEGFGLESSDAGINYELRIIDTDEVLGYRVADSQTGTGNPIYFDPVTEEGTYYVTGISGVGCETDMLNTKDLLVHELPLAFAMSGTGISCDLATDGATIGLDDFEENTTYYLLYRPGTTGSFKVEDEILTSNATTAVQSLVYAGGEYMYVARNTFGCTSNMNSSIWVDEYSMPDSPVVHYDESGYCEGNSIGVEITLEAAQDSIYYQVYDVNTGAAVSDPITDNISLGRYTEGTYNVIAFREDGVCNITLVDGSGNTDIVINAPGVLPTAFDITGNGNTCDLVAGVDVGLAQNEANVTYNLMYRAIESDPFVSIASFDGDGTTPIVTDVHSEGEYKYVATNSTGCVVDMNGSITVTQSTLPDSKTVLFDASGYCSGSVNGLELSLNESEAGVYYQVYEVTASGDVPVGNPVIDNTVLGQFTEGTYHVVAYREGGVCQITLTDSDGSQDIVISASGTSPAVMDMYGESITCDIASGVTVGLDGTPEVGITYILRYRAKGDPNYTDIASTTADVNTTSIENVVNLEGEYMYVAENSYGCSTLMANTVQVKEYSAPIIVSAIVLGNDYCPEDAGSEIVISEAEEGIYYQVLDSSTGLPVANAVTGSTSLGYYTEGTYVVVAYRDGGACTTTMADNIEVTAGSIPNDALNISCTTTNQSCTVGDDLCIENTEMNVTYTLYVNSVSTGVALEGNGGQLCFPTTLGGRYTIQAVNNNSGCSVEIAGYIDYDECNLPDVSTITLSSTGDFLGNQVCVSYTEVGYNYTLYYDGNIPKETLNGTGNELCFSGSSANEVGNYTVHVIDVKNGCSVEIPDAVYLNDYEDFVLNDDYFYFGNDLIIDRDTVNLNDRFVDGIDVVWNMAYGQDFNESDFNIRFALIEQNEEGNWERTLSIKNDWVGTYTIDPITGILDLQKNANFFGKDNVRYIAYNEDDESRIDTASVFVYIGNQYFEDEEVSILIPNAFSPNGDGVNDYFKITGLDEYYEQKYEAKPTIVSNIEIFNRWGTVVYRSKATSYGRDGYWWDGKSTESNMVSIGQDCPNGTYFYIFTVTVNITVDGQNKIQEDKFQGYIELRR